MEIVFHGRGAMRSCAFLVYVLLAAAPSPAWCSEASCASSGQPAESVTASALLQVHTHSMKKEEFTLSKKSISLMQQSRNSRSKEDVYTIDIEEPSGVRSMPGHSEQAINTQGSWMESIFGAESFLAGLGSTEMPAEERTHGERATNIPGVSVTDPQLVTVVSRVPSFRDSLPSDNHTSALGSDTSISPQLDSLHIQANVAVAAVNSTHEDLRAHPLHVQFEGAAEKADEVARIALEKYGRAKAEQLEKEAQAEHNLAEVQGRVEIDSSPGNKVSVVDNSTSNTSTNASIRLEMARRAFEVAAEDRVWSVSSLLNGHEVDEYGRPASRENELEDEEAAEPGQVTGATADLNETGYSGLAEMCCPLGMTSFVERLTGHLGLKVCNAGSLQAMVAWYYCKNQTRTFAELVEDIVGASLGHCAWIGTNPSRKCPEMASSCPQFPLTKAHRRRRCLPRKIAKHSTTDTPSEKASTERKHSKNATHEAETTEGPHENTTHHNETGEASTSESDGESISDKSQEASTSESGGESTSTNSQEASTSESDGESTSENSQEAPTAEEEVPFLCEPNSATELDFGLSKVILNNLGGMGPDDSGTESLIYENIGTFNGAPINLVVNANGNYISTNTSENGLQGNHGQINLKSGHAIELTFKFQEAATNVSIFLPEFYFTFLDIDKSEGEHQERIYASGFAHELMQLDREFGTEVLPDGRTVYKGWGIGSNWSDSADPGNLVEVTDPDDSYHTVNQRSRAVMLVFRNTNQFTVTLEVAKVEHSVSEGRKFSFSGKSSLIDLCTIAAAAAPAAEAADAAPAETGTPSNAAPAEEPTLAEQIIAAAAAEEADAAPAETETPA